MTQDNANREFALYIDDSGSAKPSPDDNYHFFALGGVLIARKDEDEIANLLLEFQI